MGGDSTKSAGRRNGWNGGCGIRTGGGDGLDLEACAARQGGGLDAGARGERRDERAGRLPRIARLVRERAPSETAPDFAAYVLAAWPDDPDARLFADALLATQSPAGEESHAERGFGDGGASSH